MQTKTSATPPLVDRRATAAEVNAALEVLNDPEGWDIEQSPDGRGVLLTIQVRDQVTVAFVELHDPWVQGLTAVELNKLSEAIWKLSDMIIDDHATAKRAIDRPMQEAARRAHVDSIARTGDATEPLFVLIAKGLKLRRLTLNDIAQVRVAGWTVRQRVAS